MAALLVALLAGAALVLALLNLASADHEIAPYGIDGGGGITIYVSAWWREQLRQGDLWRVLLFSGVTTGLASVSMLLALVGRRSVIGQLTIGIAGVILLGSAYTHVRRVTHPAVQPDPPDSITAMNPSIVRSDSPRAPSTRRASFRLGSDLAMGVLLRAHGASADRALSSTRTFANALAIAVPELPTLTGNNARNDADAMFYLKEGGGQQVRRDLARRYDDEHAALFELGITLQLLLVLHADPRIAAGLHDSAGRLAAQASVPKSLLAPLSTVSGPMPDEQVIATVTAAQRAIDAELAKEP